MLDATFNFSYYVSDGQFRISSKPTKSVKFEIIYTHTRDGKEVKEALSGGGKADVRNIYETKVLAGTQSDQAQVKHAVKAG